MRAFDDVLAVIPLNVTHWRCFTAVHIHAFKFLGVRGLSSDRG